MCLNMGARPTAICFGIVAYHLRGASNACIPNFWHQDNVLVPFCMCSELSMHKLITCASFGNQHERIAFKLQKEPSQT